MTVSLLYLFHFIFFERYLHLLLHWRRCPCLSNVWWLRFWRWITRFHQLHLKCGCDQRFAIQSVDQGHVYFLHLIFSLFFFVGRLDWYRWLFDGANERWIRFNLAQLSVLRWQQMRGLEVSIATLISRFELYLWALDWISRWLNFLVLSILSLNLECLIQMTLWVCLLRHDPWDFRHRDIDV